MKLRQIEHNICDKQLVHYFRNFQSQCYLYFLAIKSIQNHDLFRLKYICQNAFSKSATKPMFLARNLSSIPKSVVVSDGPGYKQSFKEGPFVEELASKTILT